MFPLVNSFIIRWIPSRQFWRCPWVDQTQSGTSPCTWKAFFHGLQLWFPWNFQLYKNKVPTGSEPKHEISSEGFCYPLSWECCIHPYVNKNFLVIFTGLDYTGSAICVPRWFSALSNGVDKLLPFLYLSHFPPLCVQVFCSLSNILFMTPCVSSIL